MNRLQGGTTVFPDRIIALADDPERFPLAAENDAFPYDIREVHYGLGAKPTHRRLLFTIRPDMVYVFCIRHVAQEPVTPDNL